MAEEKKKWMQRAFQNASGQLRRKTHTKAGHNIPREKLEREAHSRYTSTKTKRQANLALTARKIAARRSRSR